MVQNKKFNANFVIYGEYQKTALDHSRGSSLPWSEEQADLDRWLTGNRIASQEEIEQQAQQYLSTKRREKK